MKQLFVVALACIALACQSPKSEEVIDVTAAKEEVAALMDQFHAAMVGKDADAQAALVADGGMYAGTDPGEVWTKQAFSEYMTMVFADTAMIIDKYPIDRREIKIDDDGQCAYILEQFTMKAISVIPLRFTAHAISQDGKWLLDFTSLSLIPKNEDVPKMSAVATQ